MNNFVQPKPFDLFSTQENDKTLQTNNTTSHEEETPTHLLLLENRLLHPLIPQSIQNAQFQRSNHIKTIARAIQKQQQLLNKAPNTGEQVNPVKGTLTKTFQDDPENNAI